MTKTADYFNSIAVEALSLSAPERSELAARLLQSLHNDNYGDDSENLKIVEERLKRLESGEVRVRPVKEVVEEIREKYGI